MKPLQLAAFFMHLFHYFVLHHFTKVLKQQIINSLLIDAFSQNKDELVLHFQRNEESIFWILNCNSQLPFYYLTSDYHKANKNTATLFEETLGLEVINIELLEGERIIILQLTNQHQLIFKMFGKTTNIIHRYYNSTVDIFRHNLIEDEQIILQPCPSFQQFLQAINNEHLTYDELLQFPYWDKSFKHYIKEAQNIGNSAIETALQLYDFFAFPKYYLLKSPLNFSIIPIQTSEVLIFSDLIQALKHFAKYYFTVYQLDTKKNELLKSIDTQIKNLEYKVQSNQKSIQSIENSRSYEEIGNILMAHAHWDIKGCSKYTFQDIYDDYQSIEISLKPELSLLQNAEWYYQKHKKRKTELEKIKKMLAIHINELQKWNMLKNELLEIQTLKALDQWLKLHPELKKTVDNLNQSSLPYREFEILGYKIFVGKDAKSNDQLTLHHSHKNDIWLHAKDVSGSHVVIKVQKGQNIPQNIIEKAAELAAFYSKNRNQTFVPVIYTEKKYVRKGKGLPPGKVIVERENVIFVTPKSYEQIISENS